MSFFLKDKHLNNGPSTAELVERGFSPKNGKIDVLLIHVGILILNIFI